MSAIESAGFDAFISLADELLDDGYIVQIVHAFFDESGSHADSPVLCVAGYAFEKREARLLANEWKILLRRYHLPVFHMVDCAHGNEAFASLTRRQRINIETSLIAVIKRRAAHGFVVSVDLHDYRDVMPSWGPVGSPYAFCARSVIDEMGRWFFKTGFRGKSAYFFEAGHQSRSEADDVVRTVLTNPLNKLNDVHYGYVAHSFILKEEAPAVQAADVLAWQWATDIKHQLNGKPRRKDFKSLLKTPTRGAHFDRDRLLYYLELLKEFGISDENVSLTLDEQVKRIGYINRRVRPSLFR